MDLQGLKLAIVGATGAVGQETLRLIEARYPQHKNLKLLASKRSAGRKMEVNGKTFTVAETTDDSSMTLTWCLSPLAPRIPVISGL